MSIAYLPANTRRPAYPSTPASDQSDDRLQLLRSMLTDRRWPCPPVVRGHLLQILVSATGEGSTEESAWVTLAEEIARYLLYRRTGQLETAVLEWQRPRREHRHISAGVFVSDTAAAPTGDLSRLDCGARIESNAVPQR